MPLSAAFRVVDATTAVQRLGHRPQKTPHQVVPFSWRKGGPYQVAQHPQSGPYQLAHDNHDHRIDPHKASHTATAVHPATNTPMASLRIDASNAGYRQLLRWAAQFPEGRWAVENAKSPGCHLTQWLIPHDEHVVDVATTATSRVRELSRGGRRKNDVHGDPVVVGELTPKMGSGSEQEPPTVPGRWDFAPAGDTWSHGYGRLWSVSPQIPGQRQFVLALSG